MLAFSVDCAIVLSSGGKASLKIKTRGKKMEKMEIVVESEIKLELKKIDGKTFAKVDKKKGSRFEISVFDGAGNAVINNAFINDIKELFHIIYALEECAKAIKVCNSLPQQIN
jgi:hypothetical protein